MGKAEDKKLPLTAERKPVTITVRIERVRMKDRDICLVAAARQS